MELSDGGWIRPLAPETCVTSKRLRHAPGSVCVTSLASPDRPERNEDAALVLPLPGGALVLAVADGAGGHADGALASRTALQALALAVRESENESGFRAGVVDGIERANQAVMDLPSDAATTLAVVLIEERVVRSFHVGDSPILIVGREGQLKHEAMAHSPTGYGEASGLLDGREAIHADDRHEVCNLVGFPEMHIALGPVVTLSGRDTVVLASDGLSDNLYRSEILALASKGRLEGATRNLVDLARKRMTDPFEEAPSKNDDLTLIVFRPHAKRPKASPAAKPA